MSFVTFGEIMLRLSPAALGDKLATSNELAMGYAGAESNVATSLALLGNTTDFVSKLPNNPLGNGAILSLKKYGVSTRYVIEGGQRIGTYFIEMGASIRPSRVVYDRLESAIATISKNEFDWGAILKDKKWFHITGITPALSEQCANECVLAAKMAGKLGVNVSFDMNYRRSLWTDKSSAKTIFDKILEHTTVLFANLGALKDVYGLKFSGSTAIEQTENAMLKAQQIFGIDQMAFTVREHTSASVNTIAGTYLSEKELWKSRPYTLQVADRFGTGDAFAAGCLHAINKRWKAQKIVDFATAAFALKHTIKGDINYSNEQEIHSAYEGNLSGYVIR
ncbi:PfkB family carbohydrate kinase [Maribacter sp. 2304DJ31-5]|uniref:PfkB family carbohydrate kinase n=1 Tax=Maribacter sp. 2304DJ31-5 TaxID=3386273 RepID=UPI0039BCC903